MHQHHEIFPGLLILAVLAAAFCAWSAAGNEVNLCVTAGCTLFQDATLAGISFWWFGVAAFAALALLALLGTARLGTAFAALTLLADTGLLLLMAVTAPCISCLLVAILFALLYSGFRQALYSKRAVKTGVTQGRSLLLIVWGLVFVINAWAALRTQVGVWAVTDNAQEATVRMFFSPSCPSCKEGISLLSGHVDVAFFPVAESDLDVYKTAHMQRLLGQGASMIEALGQAQSVEKPSILETFSPDMLLLRLHMLCNKAHVFLSDSQRIPFFESQGLPPMLPNKDKNRQSRKNVTAPPPSNFDNGNVALPLDPQIAGQCSGTAPCP